jgi:hypothetical protein
MRAIGQMERRASVNEVSGAKRDRLYCAKRLLQIFDEPRNSHLQRAWNAIDARLNVANHAVILGSGVHSRGVCPGIIECLTIR